MTQLFQRHFSKESGGWLYADPGEQALIVRCVVFHGFDLSAFDTWLEDDNWLEQNRLYYLKKRANVLTCWRNGNEEMMRDYLDVLVDAWSEKLRDDVMLPLARMGKNFSDIQRKKAQNPRGTLGTDEEKTSITSIIKAVDKTDGYGDPLPSNELWPELYAELDRIGLNPVEVDSKYIYDGGEITHASFKAMLSKVRTKVRKGS